MSHEIFSRYLTVLHRTEQLSPRDLARWQLPQIERLVRHAAALPFYSDRLAPVLATGRFDARRWGEIPILTRAAAQDAGAALCADRVPPEAGLVSFGETSGSTGMPLRYGWNELASTATRMQLERFWDWHGINPAGTLGEIRAFRSGETDPNGIIRKCWSFRSENGLFAALPVDRHLDDQLAWLAALAPDYLLTYPTHALALAEAGAQAGRRLPLEAVITVGEILTPESAGAIARGFARPGVPARVLDTYGCQEAGKLALVCPQGRYHVCAENVLLEIVDDDGAPVGAGREGWVLITSLHNYAMPFIRYRLGDRAIAGDGEPCPCGRSLPVIERILGRARNMLVLPDGTRRWPSMQIALKMRAFIAFRQFQFVQTEPRRIELRYVPEKGGAEPDRAGLAAFIRQELHPEIAIDLQPVTAIPRSPGGKFEDYICLVRQ